MKHLKRWLLGSLAVAGAMSASAELPTMTTDSSNPHYYLIKNLRTSRESDGTFAAAPGAMGQIKLLTQEEVLKDDGARYEIGSLWWFEACDGREDTPTQEGFTPVRIYNALTGEAVANVLTGDWRLGGDDSVWYLKENSASLSGTTYTGFSIVSQQNMSSNEYAWNNAGGGGQLVSYWAANDPGSIWDVQEPNESLMNATAQAIVDIRLPLAKAKGIQMLAHNLNTDEAIERWNTAVAATEDGDPSLEDYQNLVSAYIHLTKSVKKLNVNIMRKLRNQNEDENEYFGVNTNDVIQCTITGQGTRAFTIVPTEDGSGFYLYNPYSNRYLRTASANDQNVIAVKTPEEASIYNFDVWCTQNDVTTIDEYLGIYDINNKPDIAYLHSNGGHNIVRWTFGVDNSAWLISIVDDETAENEKIAGAQHFAEPALTKGPLMRSLNVNTDEVNTIWDAAFEKVNGANPSLEDYYELTDAYEFLPKRVKPVKVTLQAQGRTNAFMGADVTGDKIKANAPKGESRIMQFVPTDNGEGFYLYNQVADKFIIIPTAANNSEITTTQNKADATAFRLDLYHNGTEYTKNVGFEPADLEPGGHNYLHAAGDLFICRWELSEPSSWALTLIEELSLTFTTSDNTEIETLKFPGVDGESFPTILGFTTTNNAPISSTNTSATYVMNESTPMQIYNERAASYVHVHEGGLWQTEDGEDETTNFLKVKADDDGGFIIYSPSAKKVVGNLIGSSAVTLMVDCAAAQKYYTGKYDGSTVGNTYYPVYADWIGTENSLESTAWNFFNDNANGGGKRYVCSYARVDDGSKWIIVTDKENFKENWAMRPALIDAKAAYLAALEKLGLEPDQTLVDFANNFVFEGNVNLPLSDETKTNYAKLLAAVEDASTLWPSTIMEATKLYTIVSTEGRGALIYDAENDCMSTTYDKNAGSASAPDTNDNNHLWGFVKVDDKFYLYNRGAEKFANAYIDNDGAPHDGEYYAWTVGDVPCAITLSNEAFGAAEAFNNNKFVIKGGKAGSQGEAGMMIINGNITRIPCLLGSSSNTDGTGFILTAVRDTDMDATMKTKVAEGFAMVNDKIETICMPLEGEEYEAETHGKQVGHFTQEAVADLEKAKTEAQALEDKEAAMYAAIEAIRAFKAEESNYRVVEDGNVYTISDSEGNIHFTDGATHLSAEAMPEGADAKLVNWVAAVTDGKVSFSHSHEDAEETTPAAMYYANTNVVNFAVNDATEFTVQRTAVPGKVTLNDDASKTYVITHVSADAHDAQTTHIAEIESNIANDTVYDLQGRRLAAPGKGFNIINGRKVIVK